MANALIDIPKSARKGDIVTLKALVSHAMETGYRREISGAVIPRLIIHTFTCRYDGEEIFRADLFPAMAANPLIAFTTIATKSGPVIFTWIDDSGAVITEAAELAVMD